nr:hypothetical protein 10 [bacterium]
MRGVDFIINLLYSADNNPIDWNSNIDLKMTSTIDQILSIPLQVLQSELDTFNLVQQYWSEGNTLFNYFYTADTEI